jgi:integrase
MRDSTKQTITKGRFNPRPPVDERTGRFVRGSVHNKFQLGGPKASTRKRYRTACDKFLLFAKSQDVNDWRLVDVALLNSYASHFENLSRRPKTQRNELVVLVQTVKWFINEGHLAGKEHIKMKYGRVESQRAYCWRKEEVRRIVQYCQADPKLTWLGDVIIALAFTGLRISELSSLRWPDVDLHNRMLHLPDETGYGDKQELELRDRKSGRSRSFPIHLALVPVLLRQPHEDTYVFRGPRGGRLKPDHVRNVLVNKVLSKLAEEFPVDDGARGFRDGRLHSFRHYFCSMCANEGVPIMMVMEWLGHADSAMVRHYYHLYNSESSAAHGQA